MIAKLTGGAAGDDGSGLRVEKHAVGSDREDTRQLVCDHDDGGVQALAQFDDQLVEQPRADRVQPGRWFVEEEPLGSSAIARAKPARFSMPPLISDG